MIKSQKLLVGLSTFIFALVVSVVGVNAAQLETLSLDLSDSRPGVSNTHTYSFNHPTNAVLQEIRMYYCKLPSGACTSPVSLDLSSADKGLTGSFVGVTPGEWSVTNPASNVIEFTHLTTGENILADTTITMPFTGIVNSAINGTTDCEADGTDPEDLTSDTCYVRIYTCTDKTTCTDNESNATDLGIVSYTVVEGITVSARVDPLFKFVVESVDSASTNNGITTSVTSSYSTLPFSNLTANAPEYAAHSLRVTTNSEGGYAVSMTLANQMTGVYAANNIDPFPGSWGTPRVWTQPTGTTPSVDTAWLGANTTDTDVSGWNSSPSEKFGPVTEGAEVTVMQGADPEDGSNPIYVTYGIEANVFQPGDTYQGTLIYSALPTY